MEPSTLRFVTIEINEETNLLCWQQSRIILLWENVGLVLLICVVLLPNHTGAYIRWIGIDDRREWSEPTRYKLHQTQFITFEQELKKPKDK